MTQKQVDFLQLQEHILALEFLTLDVLYINYTHTKYTCSLAALYIWSSKPYIFSFAIFWEGQE